MPAGVDLHLTRVARNLVEALHAPAITPAILHNEVRDRVFRRGRDATPNDEVSVVHIFASAVGDDTILVA